jgi:hypothetical protein
MLHIAQQIVKCLKENTLPPNPVDLFSDLYDPETNRFVYQESTHWDYKAEFPFSLADNYFAGILRLFCAYHNTYGGIIIFGVHDKTRTPGHNKVPVNIERLNNVVRETLSSPVELIYREYFLGSSEATEKKIDVVLVPKRPMGMSPIRFSKPIGSYKPNVPWMRVAHEVIEPKSIDLPKLYSSRNDFGVGDSDTVLQIESALPPSPATLKEFIGRRQALDDLYSWLFFNDEPRTFLFGKGGSGKSTIAYEFARMIGETGGNIATRQGQPIDFVIYISAKASTIDPLSRSVVRTHSYDFTNSIELYKGILTLLQWLDCEKIESLGEKALLDEIRSVTDSFQLLIVVDDIDTLTTAGKDPGMDALYRILVRSRAGGKILYTLRNAPTQSLANAIEVPGLEVDTELGEFVSACCNQFKLKSPSNDFLRGTISTITERRPLAVEVIIGLCRTAGSYEEAVALFRGRSGDQVRDYLFNREYLALPPDNRARLFLAALALLGRPATFVELLSVLQFSEEQLNDSISQTLEMFLQVNHNDVGDGSFALGDATATFIRTVSRGLTFFETLRARVQYFKSAILPKNPQISGIQFEVSRLFKEKDFRRAAELLAKPGYPAMTTQHPTFNMLKGRALSKLDPPKYEEARGAFTLAAVHGSTDVQGFREWYWMERDSGFSIFEAIEVCDTVIKCKSFSAEIKTEFYTKRGLAYSGLAASTFTIDSEKYILYQTEALSALLEAVEMYHRAEVDNGHFTKTRAQLQEAFRFLFIGASRFLRANRSDLVQLIFAFFSHEKSTRHHFDLAEIPALDCVRILSLPRSPDEMPRNRAFLQQLSGTFGKTFGLRFRDETVRSRIVGTAREGITKLSNR